MNPFRRDHDAPKNSQNSPGAIAPSSRRFAQAEFGDEVLGGARGDAEFPGDQIGVGDRVREDKAKARKKSGDFTDAGDDED